MRAPALLVIALSLALFTGACSRKPRPFLIPVLPPPPRVPPPSLIQASAPPELAAKRVPNPSRPPFLVALLTQVDVPGPPPAPPPKPARAGGRPEPAEPAPTEAPPTVAQPVPQLGRILSAAEREQHNRQIDANVARARGNIAEIARRRLTRSQADALQRIRSFIQQAEDARTSDLIRALNLSVRADVLAQDLARRVR